jgi:hypothetical protein
MREILYREYIRNGNYSEYKYKGFFYRWLVKPRKNFDSETVAIIETENGRVIEKGIDNIRFVNPNSDK